MRSWDLKDAITQEISKASLVWETMLHKTDVSFKTMVYLPTS